MDLNEKSTKKLSENKQIFLKSLFYMLSVHLLVNGITFIMSMASINSASWLFSLIAIFLVSAPTYFFLKSNIKKSWRYLANMSIFHVIFFAIEFVSVCILDIRNFFKGWELAALFVSSIILLVGLGIILLLDLIYNLYAFVSQREK